jgi:hypothetical protein
MSRSWLDRLQSNELLGHTKSFDVVVAIRQTLYARLIVPRAWLSTRNCRDERKRPPRDASGGAFLALARRGSASLPNSVGALGLAE